MIDRAWRSLRLAFLVATLIVATLALAQQRKVVANGHQFALTHDDQLSTSRFNKNEFEHADIYRFSTMRAKALAQADARRWEPHYWPGWHGSGRRTF